MMIPPSLISPHTTCKNDSFCKFIINAAYTDKTAKVEQAHRHPVERFNGLQISLMLITLHTV